MSKGNKTMAVTCGLSINNWSSLPFNRVDKAFWIAFNEYLSPLLQPDFPLVSEEFWRLSISGRERLEVFPLVDDLAVRAANELREYYDEITLWNPLSLASRLGIALSVVIEQLLLAKEFNLVSMCFAIVCQSCGCNMRRTDCIRNIIFRSTYQKSNAMRCPMCTMRTEVTKLADVGVYFEEPNPPALLKRKYHRLFLSDEAQKRRLETYFCPPGASFAFRLLLPGGRYLLIASGAGMIVELHVASGAEYLSSSHTFLPLTVMVGKLLQTSSDGGEGKIGEHPIIHADHGKLHFNVFNDTAYGGYLDIYVAFDERLEFLTIKPLAIATAPLVLHHLSRGLRSELFQCFIPPPYGARIDDVYVVQSFALADEDILDPIDTGSNSTLAVIREAHRYSLEEHRGLLLTAACGGTMLESVFLSLTAALASSLCFLQRVVTRLGEDVAISVTSSITRGVMYMASFQGKYDDDNNARSSYPDVYVVGPAVHAATHPPVVACDNGVNMSKTETRFARIELRSVSKTHTGACLRASDADEMLPQMLSFLEDRLSGLKVVREPHSLVVSVPLATLGATVLLASLLDPVMYTNDISGPFG